MTTLWKWRLYLFVLTADNTAANRQSFAEAYVNNGSGESLADERKMLDSVLRLSTSGNAPAQVLGVSTLAKAAMRDALRDFVDGLSQSLWYVTSNQRANLDALLATNDAGVVVSGQTWELADCLGRLDALRGLRVIVDLTP